MKFPQQIFRSLTFLFLTLIHLHCFGKEMNIDSLKNELRKSAHDTARIGNLNKLGSACRPLNRDTARHYILLAKALCKKHLDQVEISDQEIKRDLRSVYLKKLGRSCNILGGVFLDLGDFSSAIKSYQEAIGAANEANAQNDLATGFCNLSLAYVKMGETSKAMTAALKSVEICEQIKDERQLVLSLKSLAFLYHGNGNVKKTIGLYERCLKLYEKRNDKAGIRQIVLSLGVVQAEQGHTDIALEYYERSLKLAVEANDKQGVAFGLLNIGTVYQDPLMNYPKALDHYERSLKILKELKDHKNTSLCFFNMGIVYFHQKKNDKAKACILACVAEAEESKDKDAIVRGYSGLSAAGLQTNDLPNAIKYGLKYLQCAKEMGSINDVRYAALQLVTAYERNGDFKNAYEMEALKHAMLDSLTNEETKNVSYRSKIKYDFEKKALADSIKLQDEKKIVTARLSERAARLRQEKTKRYALWGGLLFTLIFSLIVFKRFRDSQKQKNIIEVQKKLVDDAQKKTIASINYAKKIQDSILPSSEEIAAHFKEHFIFFSPKDIVSGDFYWFHHHNNISYVAVADCTGHGVPGALMTMVAHAAILESVIEKNMNDPGRILSSLHTIIYQNLQQYRGGEYSQDGLDVSFIAIDHKQNILHFSGARNHVYLIDGDQIRILKAQSSSIGGLSVLGEHEPDRIFKTESFRLNQDTLIVMTTDGLIDQLNEKDEKFGYRNLLEMVNKKQTGFSASNEIERAVSSWKKNVPQLDDMLVVGLKYSFE
jgi:serine phosphatase RsbU (regulator of sigma subunit)/tetratricopeptide (TPR) repeat protein